MIPSALLCAYYLFYAEYELMPCRIFSIVSFDIFSPVQWFKPIETDGMRQIAIVTFMVSLLLIAFSREKEEDEYIEFLRSQSMRWSILTSSVITIIATLFVYNMAYLYFVFINIYLILILFIIKYRIKLHHFKKSAND